MNKRLIQSRRALANVLSLYGIPDRYIKVISSMCENITVVVKAGNEASTWFCVKFTVNQACVISPFISIILMDFLLRKKERRTLNQMGKQNFSGVRLC